MQIAIDSFRKRSDLRLDYFFRNFFFSNTLVYFARYVRQSDAFRFWVARPVRLRTIDPAPPRPRHPHNDTHTTTICAVYIFCVIPLGRIVWAHNILTARLVRVCASVCVCQSRAPDLIDVGGARRVTWQKCVFFPLGPKK